MVFITAEIGINHNGDIEIAKKLINALKNLDVMQSSSRKEQWKKYTQKKP